MHCEGQRSPFILLRLLPLKLTGGYSASTHSDIQALASPGSKNTEGLKEEAGPRPPGRCDVRSSASSLQLVRFVEPKPPAGPPLSFYSVCYYSLQFPPQMWTNKHEAYWYENCRYWCQCDIWVLVLILNLHLKHSVIMFLLICSFKMDK